jgi:hypothetical protein
LYFVPGVYGTIAYRDKEVVRVSLCVFRAPLQPRTPRCVASVRSVGLREQNFPDIPVAMSR